MKRLFKITGKNADQHQHFDYFSNAPEEVLCYCNEDDEYELTRHFEEYPSAFGNHTTKYRSVKSTEIHLDTMITIHKNRKIYY